jgi:hypothetical protein
MTAIFLLEGRLRVIFYDHNSAKSYKKKSARRSFGIILGDKSGLEPETCATTVYFRELRPTLPTKLWFLKHVDVSRTHGLVVHYSGVGYFLLTYLERLKYVSLEIICLWRTPAREYIEIVKRLQNATEGILCVKESLCNLDFYNERKQLIVQNRAQTCVRTLKRVDSYVAGRLGLRYNADCISSLWRADR